MPGRDDIATEGIEHRFSSTNQPANNGRKKNRFSHLKDQYNLSRSDVGNIINSLLEKTPDELQQIIKSKDTPVIILAFASAIISDIKKGNASQTENMISRLHGKPKENIDLETPQGIKIIIEKPDSSKAENNPENI